MCAPRVPHQAGGERNFSEMSHTFINNEDVITFKSSKRLLVFTAMCHHKNQQTTKCIYIFSLS